MTTPVLLITFNRPEQTREVLRSLRSYRPENLFVFQDGPREGNHADSLGCEAVRRVVDEMVDWPCDVSKNYSSVNLGCGPGPASAITWFFSHFEEGIILEDDAVAHPDFFAFATELLKRYRTDESVMAIGSMQLEGRHYGDGSYYFSKMNHTLCAWASWRRAWQLFDIKLADMSRRDLNKILLRYGAGLREREYWCARLDEIHLDGLHNSSWDQQFWMSIWRNGGKGIIPNVNLCSNIGFCKGATHTWNSHSPAAALPTHSIMPLRHPSDSSICKEADDDFQRTYFDPNSYGRVGWKNWPYRMNRRLKRLFHHEGSWLPWRNKKGGVR
ncbi:MAG: hypothetical protein IJK84_03560 [Bacteroidales bacterium]|nr:hypothetical protein [Bacteroidales bacterium]